MLGGEGSESQDGGLGRNRDDSSQAETVRSEPSNPSTTSLSEAHIGADLAVRALDPVLDLGQERIDRPLSPHRPVVGQLAPIALIDPWETV